MKQKSKAEMEYLVNPRPDLGEDSELWARLLLKAYVIDSGNREGLFWALHGMRCVGARLRLGKSTAIMEAGQVAAPEYEAWKRQYLEPHRETLLRLLREIAATAPRGDMVEG